MMNINIHFTEFPHVNLFRTPSCMLFDENTKEEIELCMEQHRGIFGNISINADMYIFYYSPLGNDGTICKVNGEHFVVPQSLKRLVKQACITYLKGGI